MDCSPPSSSIHGTLQARILEWVAISFSRGSSWPRDQTQVSHIAGRHFNLCTTREALKYKNTVSQKSSYRDTELQVQVLTSKISREERKPGWKKKGGGGRGGRKGWPYRRLLPPTDTQALWDFSLGLQKREDWNSALPEIRPDQNQNSSSVLRGGDQSPILSSSWGSFNQIPASRTRELEKQERTGWVKERKEREGERGWLIVSLKPDSVTSPILVSCKYWVSLFLSV